MSYVPLVTVENLHEYAGTSMDIPAPVGFMDATSDCVGNIKHILSTTETSEDLKQKLLNFIIERTFFTVEVSKYLEERRFESHPEYIENQQVKNKPIIS